MNMDKATLQMTLDFSHTNTTGVTNFVQHATDNKLYATSAVVISLQDVLNKRSEEQQATLYRQIASSISHLR